MPTCERLGTTARDLCGCFRVTAIRQYARDSHATGAQLKQLLEHNGRGQAERARFLQPSSGFSYAWRANGLRGERIIADSIRLDGRAIDFDQTYRVTANNFLADGGDGFRALREGTDRVGGPVDVDALIEYLRETSAVRPLVPDRAPRIRRR